MAPRAAGEGVRSGGGLYHGWKVVAACFAVASVSWGLALFGSSVYVQALSAAHGWSVATVASAVTLMYGVAAVLQPAAAGAIERHGPVRVLAPGMLALGTGVAALGLIDHLALLWPCFVLIGIGWSCLSTTGLSVTVNPWFERHQGRAITLAVMGASMGAIAGVPAMLAGIGALGLRMGLLAAAGVGLGVALPLILIVLRHRGPAALGAWPDGAAAPAGRPNDAVPETAPEAAAVGPPGSVWTVAVAFAVALAVQLGFLTHHLALALKALDAAAAAGLIGATGVAALLGRLVLARWVDRMPVRLVAAGMMLMQAATLLAMARWPTAPVLAAASLAYGFGVGYVTTLAPVIVRREQGRARFAARYGTAARLIQLTSATGPWLFGLLHDAFGGYPPVLAIAALALLAASVALRLERRARPRT